MLLPECFRIFFDFRNHRYSLCMPAPLKFGMKEAVYNHLRQFYADDSCPEAKDIGIVMASCHYGRIGLRTGKCPDPLYLITGKRNADYRTADSNTEIRLPLGNKTCHLKTGKRIVITFRTVSSYVKNFYPTLFQITLYFHLHFYRSVIISHCYFHKSPLYTAFAQVLLLFIAFHCFSQRFYYFFTAFILLSCETSAVLSCFPPKRYPLPKPEAFLQSAHSPFVYSLYHALR